jgi:hypothetical protein
MRRKLPGLAVTLLLSSLVGCAMCDSSQDCTYTASGGLWQRENPCHGRVGSLFDPADGGALTEVPVAQQEGPADDKQSVLQPDDSDSAPSEQPNTEQTPPDDKASGASEPAKQGESTGSTGGAVPSNDSLPPLELPPTSPAGDEKRD